MKQIEGQISLFDLIEPPEKKTAINDVAGGTLFRYLRHGPHTLVPEVRDKCKAYLDSVNGKLPKNFIKHFGDPRKWNPLPCSNCEYGRSGTCIAGGHTCHYEYGVLVCDAFKQTIVGDIPISCDTCGYLEKGCCDYPVTPDDYCVLGDKWISNVKPGDWIEWEHVGKQLTFDEIAQMIGQMIVMDKSTVSHAWYKVVMVEQIVMVENNTQRRLVYYDGAKQRGLVNEMYFDENIHFPARAYRLRVSRPDSSGLCERSRYAKRI